MMPLDLCSQMKTLPFTYSNHMQVCKTNTILKQCNTCKRIKNHGLNVLKIHSVALKWELRFLDQGAWGMCPDLICWPLPSTTSLFLPLGIFLHVGKDPLPMRQSGLESMFPWDSAHPLETKALPSCTLDSGLRIWKGMLVAHLDAQHSYTDAPAGRGDLGAAVCGCVYCTGGHYKKKGSTGHASPGYFWVLGESVLSPTLLILIIYTTRISRE